MKEDIKQNKRIRKYKTITADTIYIFEFKLIKNGTAQEALEQIHKQGYAEPYKTSGKKIILIGAVFGDGIDEDTPDTWIAETL